MNDASIDADTVSFAIDTQRTETSLGELRMRLPDNAIGTPTAEGMRHFGASLDEVGACEFLADMMASFEIQAAARPGYDGPSAKLWWESVPPDQPLPRFPAVFTARPKRPGMVIMIVFAVREPISDGEGRYVSAPINREVLMHLVQSIMSALEVEYAAIQPKDDDEFQLRLIKRKPRPGLVN